MNLKHLLSKFSNRYAFACALSFSTSLFAEDFYVAQSAIGNGAGSSAANAYAISFCNNSSNWGAGNGKISPGDTVHLVGLLSTTLTLQGSGSNGSPISIVFEPGAKLSKPYWGTDRSSGIYAEGKSFIIIDGKSTGIVENTSNGDTLSNNQASYGITFTGGSNNTVQNLRVQNIYVHTAGTPNRVSTYTTRCIFAENVNNFTVKNCILDHAYMGIYVLANGRKISGIVLERNSIAKCSTAIVAACGGSVNDALDDFSLLSSDIEMGGNWFEVANENHIDGIHTWTGAGSMARLSIDGNYFHGNPSKNCTSQIYLTDNLTTSYIFNNVIAGTLTAPAEGYINLNLTGTSDAYILNNTIVGLGSSNTGGNGIAVDPSRPGNRVHVYNNIISNCFVGFYDGSAAATWKSDNNVIYNCGGVGYRSKFYSLANWSALIGGDLNSTTNNPNLSSSYTLLASSSARGTGTNLSALSIAQGLSGLVTDISGLLRSSWDIGMAQAATNSWSVGAVSGASAIAPPTNAAISIITQ